MLTVFTVGHDKHRARKRKWRYSEKYLFLLAIIGGSIAMLIANHVFRHKTKKRLFTLGLPVVISIQLIIVLFLYF
nr:DUF1294 domain-containing protein [Evansella cellulosilytica]